MHCAWGNENDARRLCREWAVAYNRSLITNAKYEKMEAIEAQSLKEENAADDDDDNPWRDFGDTPLVRPEAWSTNRTRRHDHWRRCEGDDHWWGESNWDNRRRPTARDGDNRLDEAEDNQWHGWTQSWNATQDDSSRDDEWTKWSRDNANWQASAAHKYADESEGSDDSWWRL